jgi:hypothetical protein
MYTNTEAYKPTCHVSSLFYAKCLLLFSSQVLFMSDFYVWKGWIMARFAAHSVLLYVFVQRNSRIQACAPKWRLFQVYINIYIAACLVVGITQSIWRWAPCSKAEVKFPAETRNFTLLHGVQTGSGANVPESIWYRVRGLFQWGNAVEILRLLVSI